MSNGRVSGPALVVTPTPPPLMRTRTASAHTHTATLAITTVRAAGRAQGCHRPSVYIQPGQTPGQPHRPPHAQTHTCSLQHRSRPATRGRTPTPRSTYTAHDTDIRTHNGLTWAAPAVSHTHKRTVVSRSRRRSGGAQVRRRMRPSRRRCEGRGCRSPRARALRRRIQPAAKLCRRARVAILHACVEIKDRTSVSLTVARMQLPGRVQQ